MYTHAWCHWNFNFNRLSISPWLNMLMMLCLLIQHLKCSLAGQTVCKSLPYQFCTVWSDKQFCEYSSFISTERRSYWSTEHPDGNIPCHSRILCFPYNFSLVPPSKCPLAPRDRQLHTRKKSCRFLEQSNRECLWKFGVLCRAAVTESVGTRVKSREKNV